jgi:hypothetical protein
VRKALEPLQFVEKDTIMVDVKTQRVVFTVTAKRQFKDQQVTNALKDVGFPNAKVLSGPSGALR